MSWGCRGGVESPRALGETTLNQKQITRIANLLKQARGSEEALTRLGRETGFTERLRAVTPLRLAVALIGSRATRRVETIASCGPTIAEGASFSIRFTRRADPTLVGDTIDVRPLRPATPRARAG